MTVFRAEKQHIARIAQLINKTNQFNLTTIRRTADEVDTLARSPAHLVLGMELKDKYGDYGLVGVAILEKNNDTCVIDTFLMSCRILGRDAETAFIAQIAAAASSLGCTKLEGRYTPTAKNGMTAQLYGQHGFSPHGGGLWQASLGDIPTAPPHMHIKMIL
jgi:FkbH-like protein